MATRINKKAKKEFLILVKIIPFYGDVSVSLVCFDNLDNSKCGCPRVSPPWAHRSYATEDWSVRAVTISQETTCHYKGAVSTLAHNKAAMTSCPLSIFSNLTGIMLLVLIKYISFLASSSTTDKWVFLTLKIMNRPFKGYLPNSP